MSEDEFNPQSTHAQFAVILYRLSQQDTLLKEIRTAQQENSADIEDLKKTRDDVKSRRAGGVAVISMVVGILGWGISQGFSKIFDRG